MQKHNYTRQRQGRDFSITNYLRNAEIDTESNYNNIDGVLGNNELKDDTEKNKSLLKKLEHYKEETERNAVPVDGFEPERER